MVHLINKANQLKVISFQCCSLKDTDFKLFLEDLQLIIAIFGREEGF